MYKKPNMSRWLSGLGNLFLIVMMLVSSVGLDLTSVSAAPAGTALQFNGTNQYVTFGQTLGAATFTIEAWFNRSGTGSGTDTSGAGGGGLQGAIPLVAKGRGQADGSNVDMNYFLGISSTGRLAADFEEGVSAGGTAGLNHAIIGTTPILNNTWYHAAATYDGQTFSLYLNGNLEATVTLAVPRPPRADSIQHAGFGAAMDSTGARAGFFAGVIDEVRIWNVAHTQAEIQSTKDGEITSGTGLLGRWGVNEGSGTAVGNSVVGGPNGTTGNGPLWVTGFPIPDANPPAAPTGLAAVAGTNQINLTWSANAESDLAGYNLYRSATTPVPTNGTPLNGSTPITGTSYLDQCPFNGDNYYALVAVDTSNNVSDPSTEANASITLTAAGCGLQFNGSSNYVTFGTAPGLGVTTFTLEAWVKRSAGGAAMGTGTGGLGTGSFPMAYPVLTKGRGEAEAPANLNTNYWLGIATTGVIAADFEDTAGGVNHPVIGTGTIPVGEWHHIAATYDGQTWRLYLDGVLDATSTLASPFTPESTSVQHAALGSALQSNGSPGSGPGYFAGVIDEARVWNVARTQALIQGDKNVEITSGAGLVARWGINEGSGSVISSSVGSFNGTLTNNPLWVPGFSVPGNSAPVAVADTYSTLQDTARIEATPGVLANDNDPDNDPLTAILVTDVSHGVLSLAANGGFTYTPTTGYTGPDSFTYKANDGTSDSNPVTVSLTVTAPAVPLVGWWQMENNAQDSSTYANHGTLIGSPTFVAGQVGQAISLNGTQNISVPDHDSLDLTTALTIAAWIRPSVAAPATQDLVSKQQASGTLVNGYGLSLSSAGKVFIRFNQATSGDTYRINSVTNYPLNNTAWMHVAATYDGTTMRLYINGIQEGGDLAGPATIATNNLALGIGAQSDNNRRFTGLLDDVRIEARALSASEIAALAEAGANQAPDAPTLNAPANGATGVGTSPTLDVNVSDSDDDPLMVTFFGRPSASGVFEEIAQNTNVLSGNLTTPWSNLDGGQQYEWYVTVSDGTVTTTGPTWSFRTSPGSDPVFVGVGDIAECTNTNDSDTAAIVQGVDGTVFTTGDNVYPTGTTANFTNCYGPSWGVASIKSRTRPIPGNHDWGTGSINSLTDYFAYFGANATDTGGNSYYSYDIPGSNWHVVNLDSECQLVPGGCANGSPQETWLEADLAANMSKNVIALWHKPRFSSGATNYADVQPFLNDLYAAGADLVLVGHDHIYERFAPLNASGTPDPTFGIRHITIGTGGAGHHSVGSATTGSEVRNATTYGILKLTLHESSYDWKFMPIAGSTFTDVGTGSVHSPPVPVNTPTHTPTNTSAPTATETATQAATSTATQTATDVPTATATHTPTASATPTQIPPCEVDTTLVGCWKMEENGGTTLFDGSSFANHASITGTPIWSAGRVGSYSLLLDGSTEYASVADNASLDITNQITAMAWIKPGRVATQDLVKKAVNGATNGFELSLAASNSNWPQKVFFRINQVTSGDTYRVNSTTVYPIDGNTWMHVAATFDGTNLRIYINGQLEATTPANGQTIATNNLALGIGAQSDGTRWYQGGLDDVRIYNRALLLTEIQQMIGVPTATPTFTETPTDLPTATHTATDLPTATHTPTDLPTPTETGTAIATATHTPTHTPTDLPTATHTPTFTPTPSVTPPPPGGLACTALQPKPMTASTGEKPQSKVWNHGSAWWAVFPTSASGASSAGTWLWKLQGTSWVEVLKLSNSTTTKADVKSSGNVAHVLLYDGAATQLVSAEYNGATYQPWTARPAASNISLSGSEIATLEIDSNGRMWLATENDVTDQIIVYYSDSPYSTWNGPVTLATGVHDDDIAAIVKLPDQIGVLWSNQNTQRFGFRLHNDGDAANTWSTDEVPASQSALNVGLGMADDHLNMKVALDGTIYAAVKTSYDTAGFTKVALLVRRPNGTWDNLYPVDESGTRGIVILDEANSVLTMVYTASEGFNSIVYKQSRIPTINFGTRNTLRSGSFNDVSSTKSNYNGEIVLMYASSIEVAGQLCAPPSASNITISGTPLSAFSSQPGVPSAEQSYSVSGSGLTGNITITAPTDFEVSTTSGSGFGSSVTLTQSGGTVPATTIYVRFNRATAGSSSGNITHVSAGATTQNVAVSGSAGSSGSVTFAAFGDYGDDTVPELNVSNLVKSWNPDFIITTGDNSYDATPIDDNVGKYYSDFIGNYVGAHGSGSPQNRFFPSIGNHDYTDGGGSAPYFNYFTLPGNERYYDYVQGPVHFFVIDSNPAGTGNAPGDGRSPTSAQGMWLQAQLAASTSPWKIVYFHHPPYSSGGTHGSEVAMQWPFEAWGATAVLGGHDHHYERILRDDNNNGVVMPYFISGSGGRSVRPLGTTVAGSQVRYAADFGSMRIQASSSSITFEFWSIAGGGTLIDTYTMNAVSGGTFPIAAGSAWKYLDNGTDQGTAWKEAAFDDSAWASGPAELGYGDTADGRPENTLVNCGPSAPTCNANNFITTYFRKEFNVPDRSIYSGLNLGLLRDDGAVVYLNGAEIWRTNMPTGTVTSTTLASTAIGSADETIFVSPPAPLANTLVDGTNVLAVEIHQSSATSTDISFDLTLSGVPTGPTCYALTLSHTGNGTSPTASPANSSGCPADQYLAGQAISLSGAVPDAGWQIAGWFGTSNNTSTGNTNSLTMPASNHSAGVNYSASSSGTTVSFQEGVGGYNSTLDNHIKQGSPTTSFGSAITVEWDTEETSGNPATQVFGLIRFENIFGSGGGQIPPGATITSASLQYTVTNTTANTASSVNEALVTWDETTTYNTFGATAGVQPEDYGTLVTTAPGNSLTTFTINVTSSLAAWSSNPASNHGWIIRPAGTDGVDIASSENATVVNRPKLTVTYASAPTTPPAAPSALAASLQQANQVHLTWTDNANNEASFELERSTTGINGTYTLLATLPANTITHDDSNLTASQEYCYQVRAVNAIGQSSYAGPVCATALGAEALDLGNGSAYVTFGNPASLGLSQLTLETWFKREGTGTNANTGTGGVTAIPLITKGVGQADNSNLDMNYFLGIRGSDNVICADFEEGSGGTSPGLNHPVCGSTAILNNVWYHVAATYDGVAWRLYVNGNLDATLNVNQPVRSDSIQHAGLGVALTSTGTASGHFDGVLDEVRIWNFARTQTQIRAALNSQLTNSQTGLVARWALNDGGATVAGSAGTTVNGTINGTGYTWVTPGAPYDIVINDPPNTPVLVSPANNVTNVSTSPTLQATVSDPDGGNLNVTFYGRPVSAAPPAGPDFTIVVVPDTQYYTSSLNGGSPAIMQSQMNWIVNNIASENIVFVTQLGDCAEHGDQFEVEWQNADAAFDLIENPATTGMTQGMPYGIAVGNHDQSPIGNPNGTTTFYNQYFGETRFQGRTYYGGHFGTNNDNHYELFSASGLDFIVVHLEYDPNASAAVLAWADGLLQTHSNRRAIVVTHHMINGGNPGSFSAQGQAIYNTLRDNPNLFLLLGGHVPSPAEGQRQDTFNGNVVHSLLSDYQGRTNGGNGWMRIMTFSPANNTIQVQTYSPWLNQFETDADSQFTLAYNMQGSGAPFTQIGTTSVPSGSTASITWPGRAANTQYEWYAAASDGISVANSSTFTFTTGGSAPTATATGTASQTPTNTPVLPTATSTPTNTLVPPTATQTPTSTPVPPTSTPTNTATATQTPVPPTSTLTTTATATNAATDTPTQTPTFTPIPPGPNAIYLSFTGSGTVGGVAFADEDILHFNGTSWSLFFDGSDVGVGSPDLFAFSIVDADTILMSFSTSVTVNGITAAPQDILRFDATSLGSLTTGTFSLFFDGSDVGLESSSETIDSLTLVTDGRLLISTNGNPSISGLTGLADEDVLAFTPTSLGSTTAGTWALYFDGSDVGLANSSDEDIDGLDVTANGIYLSSLGNFAVSGVSGADEDVFVCVPTSTGSTTACNYSTTLYFDGSAVGLASNDVDGLNLPPSGAVPTPTSTATSTQTPTSTAGPSSTPTSTATSTPTGGPTSTATATATRTPTITPTVTSVTTTFTPIADSYVDANSPTTNYGSLSTLRADGSPVVRSYLRFNIQGLNGNVTKATLRIFANSNHSLGIDARGVSNNTWTESTINFNNAPPVGSVLGSSGSVSANTWKTIDVTSFITGNGVFNLAVTTNSSTAISLASRQSGANAPQLIIETGGGSIPTATFTPTATSVPTATQTPTFTVTPTSVGTSTPTPTATTSATPTPTQPASSTPTPTHTPSATPTATQTQTATGNLFTFNPVADSYVNSSSPTTNYGTSTQVRVDGSPIVRSYLRFSVQGVGGTVTRATLRIYANSASSSSLAASGVSNNTWTETGINYNNAPQPGSSLGSAGPVVAGTWISIDITAYITGNGVYNLALTTPGGTAISLASRESGAHSPQLLIETGP